MSRVNLIGICGYAGVGKDTLGNILMDQYRENGVDSFKESFANEVRHDLDFLLTKHLGISAFTEDPKEKLLVRPLLITWGTKIMREQVDLDYWVKRFKPTYEDNMSGGAVTIMTDLRFENELEWINSVGGRTIWLERKGVTPLNEDEEKYTKPLKNKCTYKIEWLDFKGMGCTPKAFVDDFLKTKW
jgi:hypothetical protein